jgi:hypothetical protein
MAPMNWLETAQHLITASQRVDAALQELERDRAERHAFQQEMLGRFGMIDDRLNGFGDRIARLEAFREADRAAAGAELERFKLQVERARLELAPSFLVNLLPRAVILDSRRSPYG